MRIFSAEGRFALSSPPIFSKDFLWIYPFLMPNRPSSSAGSLAGAERAVRRGRRAGSYHIVLRRSGLRQDHVHTRLHRKRCPEGRMRKSPARALPCATAIPRRPPSSIVICTARRAHCPMKWTRRWIRNPDLCSSNGPSGLRPRICPRNVWTSCFKSAKITGW